MAINSGRCYVAHARQCPDAYSLRITNGPSASTLVVYAKPLPRKVPKVLRLLSSRAVLQDSRHIRS